MRMLITLIFLFFTVNLTYASDEDVNYAIDFTTYASDEDVTNTKFWWKIKTKINNHNSRISKKVYKHITHELKELDNVRLITNNSPNYTIEILVFKTRLKDYTETGYAMSIVINKHFNSDPINKLIGTGKSLDQYKDYLSRLVLTKEHKLYYGPPERLHQDCIDLVSKFNKEILSEKRKELNDYFSKKH